MEPYTQQSAFNKVWEHFVVNKGLPSLVDGSTLCQYRAGKEASSPLRCAIGVLIPDEQYVKEFDDNFGATIILRTVIAKLPIFSNLDFYFLSSLQRCHDGEADRSDQFSYNIKERLISLADSYNLTLPE